MGKKTITKEALAAYIAKATADMKFDPQNGWAQVERKGEEVNREYGKWDALRDLAQEFDLELP